MVELSDTIMHTYASPENRCPKLNKKRPINLASMQFISEIQFQNYYGHIEN